MNILTNRKKIQNMIYEIRGKYVILDRDLSKLYKVETRLLNQKVKRNIERFPTDFCFQMTDDEFYAWKSQNVMSENDKIGLRRPPYVFTEQGVAMVSAIIKTDIAVEVSIQIMNAFVEMKKYVSFGLIEQKYINSMLIKHDNEIKLLQESIYKIDNTKSYDCLFFEGQIYDAYSVFVDILNSSSNEIIIIDNYVNKKLFDILRNIDRKIIIITNKYNNEDYEKYKYQYKNVNIRINNNIHDRFIILDRKVLYHCGASMKDLGKKCFAINKIVNDKWINDLLNEINLHN